MFASLIDSLSRLLARLAEATVVVLVVAMLYEVAARYVFDSPTIWAFDISYMATGVLFVLGAANTLRLDKHIRIDLVEQLIGRRRSMAVFERMAYVLLLLPLLMGLTWVAGRRFLHALRVAEVDAVSPWAPLLWPFYLAIALGLGALFLQTIVEVLRPLRAQSEGWR